MNKTKPKTGDKLSVRLSAEERERLSECVRKVYGEGDHNSFDSHLVRILVKSFCDYIETGKRFTVPLPGLVEVDVSSSTPSPGDGFAKTMSSDLVKNPPKPKR